MAYQVIARKWRPQSFAELIGQEHISQTLTNAVQNDRLPHALLFTGPRGTGKTSSARILAKALRCPDIQNLTPCNLCNECQAISQGISVDVIEIDGASNNGVDAVRELRESVGYRPSSGKYKIYIIDEVHMLSGSAFNALLKTLEEPPEHVVFILATTEVHKIPQTILSRCQRFDFRRISTKKICQHLETICQNEKIQFEPEALWSIARQGDGSMRDSQSLLDQVVTFSANHITVEKVVQALGLTDRRLLTKTIEALIKRDLKSALDVVDHIFASGIDVKTFSQDLLEEIRHLLLIKIGSPDNLSIVDLPDSEIEFLRDLTAYLKEEDIHILFDMALKGVNDIPKAQEPRLVLEMLILRMAQAPRIVNLSTFIKNCTRESEATEERAAQILPPTPLNKVKNELQSEVKNASKKDRTPTSSLETPTLSTVAQKNAPSLEEKWLAVVENIKSVNSLIAAKLEHSYPISLHEEKLVIAIPSKMKFLHQQVSEPDFQKKLKNYIKTFWGHSYDIDIHLEGEKKTENLTPKKLTEKKETDLKQQVLEEVENHPLVKQTRSIFKTQIQEIKEIKS